MPFRTRNIVREMGTACAVLALYVLLLLTPLHQASALQRDLSVMGFTALDTWSTCAVVARDGGQRQASVKCAAAGIGKNDLAPLEPAILPGEAIRVAAPVVYSQSHFRVRPGTDRITARPRAPPVTA